MRRLPPGSAARLLTRQEIQRVRRLLDEDWIEASVLVDHLVDGPEGMAIQALAEIAGWSDEERAERSRDKKRQAALSSASLVALKQGAIGLLVTLVLSLGLAWQMEWQSFLEVGFPLALGAWVLWTGARAGGSSGAAWIVLGIVLIPVSGLLHVATRDVQDQVSLAVAPVMFTAMVMLSLGTAQVIFGATASFLAPSSEHVRSARLARRVTSINLAVQAFVVQLAFYGLILAANSLEDDIFNAVFGHLLFVPAMGLALALSLASSATRLANALLAAMVLPVFCLLHWLMSEHGFHAFILQWALADIVAVLFALLVGARVVPPQRSGWRDLGARLAGAVLLGLLAFRMMKLGVLELSRLGVVTTVEDFILWIIAPAALAVLSGKLATART